MHRVCVDTGSILDPCGSNRIEGTVSVWIEGVLIGHKMLG